MARGVDAYNRACDRLVVDIVNWRALSHLSESDSFDTLIEKSLEIRAHDQEFFKLHDYWKPKIVALHNAELVAIGSNYASCYGEILRNEILAFYLSMKLLADANEVNSDTLWSVPFISEHWETVHIAAVSSLMSIDPVAIGHGVAIECAALKSDTKSDKRKKRKLSDDGGKVAVFIKRLRSTGAFETKGKAIRLWMSEQPDPQAFSYDSLDRELSDNPGYWK